MLWGSNLLGFESLTLRHSKYQLLIQRLVLFFYPITAQKPWWQRVFRVFSWNDIPRTSSFRSCKQARKAESLSAPVFFYPAAVKRACFLVLSNNVLKASFATRSSRFFAWAWARIENSVHLQISSLHQRYPLRQVTLKDWNCSRYHPRTAQTTAYRLFSLR